MSLSSPPDEISSLSGIIADAAAWTTYDESQIYWANALPDEFPDSGPIAVLALLGNRTARILLIAASDMTQAQLHSLARDLAFQIQSRYRADMTGLHIPREPTVSEVGEPSEAMKTAGDDRHAVEIDFPYGISID